MLVAVAQAIAILAAEHETILIVAAERRRRIAECHRVAPAQIQILDAVDPVDVERRVEPIFNAFESEPRITVLPVLR